VQSEASDWLSLKKGLSLAVSTAEIGGHVGTSGQPCVLVDLVCRDIKDASFVFIFGAKS